MFSRDALQQKLAKVKADKGAEANAYFYRDSPDNFLNDLRKITDLQEFSFRPIQILLNHWAGSDHECIAALQSKIIYRQQVQLSKVVLWDYIDKMLEVAWEDAWQDEDGHQLNPLFNLFQRVSTIIDLNKSQTIHAMQYLPGWPETCVAQFSPHVPHLSLTSQTIIDLCQNIIEQWLALPSDATHQSATVVRFFVDQLGPEATLVDLPKVDLLTPEKEADILSKLELMPIYQADSEERDFLHQIANVSGAPDQRVLSEVLVHSSGLF